MKIRLGFVSNSSVSSFIILVKTWPPLKKYSEYFIATPEDIKKAKEYGFEETTIVNPFRYEELMSVKYSESIERPDHLGLAFHVICNQDEVMYFLVKNNIPFKASVHYQNQYYCYGRDWDYILRAENFGITMCMYGEERTEESGDWKIKPVRKMPKDKWLKQMEIWGADNEN